MPPIIHALEKWRSVPMVFASMSISAYQQVSRLTREADAVIRQAMEIKSRASFIPMLESGTGRMVNLVA